VLQKLERKARNVKSHVPIFLRQPLRTDWRYMRPASCYLLLLCHESALTSACPSLHIPGTGSPCGLERKETHPELDQPFDEAMILLDKVVEIFTLPQFTRAWHDPFRFELLKSLWISRVFINRDDARNAGMRCSKYFREETFGCLSISRGTEQKFQGVSVGIHGAIEIHPDLFHFDVGLIDAP
jgi:hypothetical protein